MLDDNDRLCNDIEQLTTSSMADIDTPESRPSSPALTQTKRRTWVQTDRANHEAWGRLTLRSPRAAALAHYLTANMDDHNNAVAASHGTLAKVTGMSVATVKRAIDDLKADRWIEVVQLGGKGGANAFVVNDRVAWTKGRDQLYLSRFSASIIADRDEQQHIDDTKLRALPSLRPGELQLPTGPGEDPPAQPTIEGMEPDLPALQQDEEEELPIDWKRHIPRRRKEQNPDRRKQAEAEHLKIVQAVYEQNDLADELRRDVRDPALKKQ